MQGLSGLDEIVKALEQHENAARIKKLIFYACQNRWENNPYVLGCYELRDLIQELKKSQPTIEALGTTLYDLAKTLNRSTEYSLVARTIISQLGVLYTEPKPNDSTQVIESKPKPPVITLDPTAICDEIVRELEQHKSSFRIKKLIFYVCKGMWESDPDILEDFPLPDLIQELRDSYSTIDQLVSAINGRVQTLNRQAEYFVVASVIISQFGKLYSNSIEPTQIKFAKTEQSNQSSSSETQLLSNPQKSAQREQDWIYDPFDLRLKVMKYANPLRAKLLVFSAIHHPFKANQQDWSLIQQQTLDDLLLTLFLNCKTLEELESKLYGTARCLESPFESTSAANAIVQSLKPFYANG